MPQAAHPTIPDVQALYQSAGLIPDATQAPFSSINWAAHLAAAITTFAARSGRVIPASAGTRTYDPPRGPRGVIALMQDLCSDPLAPVTVVVSGVPQVRDRDYFLGPDNADVAGLPWEWIELPSLTGYAYLPLVRRSIQVTGFWGYSLGIPEDVWLAECQYAAALCAPAVSLSISNGIWKQEDVQYGGAAGQIALSTECALWKSAFEGVVTDKKRVTYF